MTNRDETNIITSLLGRSLVDNLRELNERWDAAQIMGQ